MMKKPVLAVAFATAQVYPSRSITMGMPFAAGGPGDTLARILGERMRVSLGQSVMVENATGAAGSIGAGRARNEASSDRGLGWMRAALSAS
jgi:tripartite-type tricarboxylate transporter receptor subunit TctC